MPAGPTSLARFAELHGALAGSHEVVDNHALDVASYLLGVAAALTWVEGVDREAPIARMERLTRRV